MYDTYALVGPFTSPRRYGNLLRTMALCLAKVSASSHTLVPWVAWQCARILLWSSAGILSHFPICLKLQNCLGLVHFLLWKQEKEQYFFERLAGNNSEIGVPSLHRKRPALVKSFALAAVLTFCFLLVLSRAGVLGGEVLDLIFPAPLPAVAEIAFTAWYFGFASRGVKFGTESGNKPYKM
jgi:hypothetical protein